MQPENGDYFRFLAGKSDNIFGVPAIPSLNYSSSPFYPWEVSEITETPEARARAALKNHKEAEKRRRERINSHLDKLRDILPCNSKTDKASLLAKVVQRMKELKEQTSHLIHLETFPSENDEITISNLIHNDENKILIKASLCCEDRSDLIPDLIKTLRSLSLSPLRAEMATVGGRTRNILIVTGVDDRNNEMVTTLKDALKTLVHRSSGPHYQDVFKRRRSTSGSLS